MPSDQTTITPAQVSYDQAADVLYVTWHPGVRTAQANDDGEGRIWGHGPIGALLSCTIPDFGAKLREAGK